MALVAIAFVVALMFGGRAAWRLANRLTRPPPPPRQTDLYAIAGWMTVPYVARTYRVPPEELYDALGVSPEGRRASTLDAIASGTGRTSTEVLDTVRAAVEAWQRAHPSSKPGPPGRGSTDRGPPAR